MVFSGQAQELFRSTKWLSQTIRAKSFEKAEYGYQAFSYLGINQGRHIDQVYIDWQSSLLTTVVRANDEQVTVFLKLFNSKADGFVRFREFFIDTLLRPSVLYGTVDLYAGANKISSAPVSTLYNGGYITFDLAPTDDKVRAEFKLGRLEYTREDYENLVWWGTLINYYYSYSLILQQSIDQVQKENIGRNSEASEVFLTWHRLNRINNYVSQYDFYNKLHLDISDPKNFNESYKKSQRLERRYLTLSEQILNSDKKSTVSDKHNFCENFSLLSRDFLSQSENYQPWMALGFYELIRIFPDSTEIKMVASEASYYDIFNKLSDGSTFQLIYNNYIEQANLTFAAGKDVATLDILRNASWFSNTFKQVIVSSQFEFLFTQTLETLLDSYLKVAIMSYKAGNFEMAEDYADRALEIFYDSKKELADIQLSPGAFKQYNHQQVDLANTFLKDNKYKQSIKLLDNAANIMALGSDQSEKGRIDSSYSVAYTGIYNKMLDSIGMLPDMNNTEDKLRALEFSQAYSEKHKPYVITDNATANLLANSLFKEFYRKGAELLIEEKADEALKNLLKAKYINESYFHSTDAELDTLIYNATVPVILEMIKQAEFETWANRMERANELYKMAKDMQIAYKQENQPELISAFSQLNEKMRNRVCITIQQNIDSKAQVITNRLNSGKIDEAMQEFKKLQALIHEYPSCSLDLKKLDKISSENSDLFFYEKKKNELETMYLSNQYEELIIEYDALSEYFIQKKLARYKIEDPPLTKYVEKKNNPELTEFVSGYYAKKPDFILAFKYLQILKKQHVQSKSTKDLQEKIGEGLGREVKKNNADSSEIENIVKGDDWYKYFRSAYSGGIIGKLLFLTGHN